MFKSMLLSNEYVWFPHLKHFIRVTNWLSNRSVIIELCFDLWYFALSSLCFSIDSAANARSLYGDGFFTLFNSSCILSRKKFRNSCESYYELPENYLTVADTASLIYLGSTTEPGLDFIHYWRRAWYFLLRCVYCVWFELRGYLLRLNRFMRKYSLRYGACKSGYKIELIKQVLPRFLNPTGLKLAALIESESWTIYEFWNSALYSCL